MAVDSSANHRKVAKEIEDLSREAELASRAEELLDLSGALRSASTDPRPLEPWAEIDLLDAFARPESLTVGFPAREHPAWGWLETLLGGLVFVPLALTWLGLTRASSAYEALTGTDPKAATRPFLQLWQSGFEGRLTGFFTFGHVAGFATGAILVLLVLALVHGWRRTETARREKEGERRVEDLLRRMVPVLTRAQLCLNAHRLSSPVRFAEELTKSAATLNRLGTRAAKTQQEIALAAALVGESLDKAQQRLAGVDTAVRPLETAANRIEDAVRGSGKEVEASVSGNGVMVRKALEDVRGMSGEVRDVLEKAGTRVEDSVLMLAAAQRAFTTGIEVSGDLSGQVLDRLTEIVTASARNSADTHALLGRFADQADVLTGVAERLGRASDTLAEALARLAPGDALPGPRRQDVPPGRAEVR
ncbi:methyl-accepting chemotaxis protein [Streptomyces sp. NPDC093071]|uniref:methyl-accepting chemotaxis protein n=1 Tax=Streptomyces sp. NPDC093071 TaxID=3366022 RepID=UPI0037F44135